MIYKTDLFAGTFDCFRCSCDSTDKESDVEIQRKDAGAGVGQCITENDVMKGNQPTCPVERYVAIGENKVLFGDDSHIIYVNGKYRGNDFDTIKELAGQSMQFA